jgi:carboxypeptidase D
MSEVLGKAMWERTRDNLHRRAKPAMVIESESFESDIKARATNKRFLTNKTEKFEVTSMPDVDFDIGEMYAGNIPIGTNASEALYFVFQPKLGAPVDEITIWLNGGPGCRYGLLLKEDDSWADERCSSLEGFFQENGRFLWQWGLAGPIENPYSWVNLTNVLWYVQKYPP